MVEYIADSEGRTYSIEIEANDDSYYAFVLDGNRWVGEARCLTRNDGTMTLADIRIREVVAARHPAWLFFIPWRAWRRLTGKRYRGKGLGTALLQHVIHYARSHGLKRIVGEVVVGDLENGPWLLNWYAKNGFTVIPSDDGSLSSRAALIYYDLER